MPWDLLTVNIKVYTLENKKHQSQQTTVDIKVYTQNTEVETLTRLKGFSQRSQEGI